MSTFVLKREYALQMPTNYVEIDRDEMEYVDGGWDPRIVLKNAVGMTAVAGLAWVGNAITSFVRANPNLGLGTYIVKIGGTALRAFWALPLWAKALCVATAASMVYALGTWDIF